MFELNHVKGNTYYFDSYAKVGIFITVRIRLFLLIREIIKER